MWNHASSRGDSSSLLCKAGNVPHFLLKHIVSNRRGPDGCYFNPKLMDLGRFSYKGLKKLLILSLVQRGFRRMRQILNCKPGTEVLFAHFPKCSFFWFFFLLNKEGSGLVSRSDLPAFVATLQKVLILLTWVFTFCLLKVNQLVSAWHRICLCSTPDCCTALKNFFF